MAKYHINSKGNPGQCRAKEKCPLGGDEEHFGSPEEARSAYEAQMADATLAVEKLKNNDVKKQIEDKETLVEDLQETIKDYRNPSTSEITRKLIHELWKTQGIPNQFAAALRVGELKKEVKELEKELSPKSDPPAKASKQPRAVESAAVYSGSSKGGKGYSAAAYPTYTSGGKFGFGGK